MKRNYVDRMASLGRRTLSKVRGDWRSGRRAHGYGEYLLKNGRFPRHVEGPEHVDRILLDAQVFVDLAEGFNVDVIVDIGALNGIETRVLACAFPNARVFTFEPVAESASEVRWITRHLSNVTVLEMAVSDTDGYTNFFVTSNRGTSSLLRPLNVGPTRRASFRQIHVPTTTIETWARDWMVERIDPVWMDVQGAEDLVLRGLGSLLKDVKLLKTEMGLSPYYEGHARAGDLRPILEGAGLVQVHTATESPWETDVVWKRLESGQRPVGHP